jgi:hypothetical protein
MAYTSLLTHIVFSTKDRRPFFGAAVLPRVHQYLGGIVKNMKGMAITTRLRRCVSLNPTANCGRPATKGLRPKLFPIAPTVLFQSPRSYVALIEHGTPQRSIPPQPPPDQRSDS